MPALAALRPRAAAPRVQAHPPAVRRAALHRAQAVPRPRAPPAAVPLRLARAAHPLLRRQAAVRALPAVLILVGRAAAVAAHPTSAS